MPDGLRMHPENDETPSGVSRRFQGDETAHFSEQGRESLALPRCWPIDPAGPLPHRLLEPEFVAKAFFRALPKHFGCQPRSVRKGLKDLFRDYVDARASRLAAAVPTERRDAELAMGVCDHPKARAQLNKLEIAKEKTITNRGRLRSIDFSLPELLWLPYTQEPDLREVCEWVKSISVGRLDLGKGYFLTADALRRSRRDDGASGANLDPVDVARAVVIFAGLLPAGERLALFEAAIDVGIPLIAEEFRTTSRFPDDLTGVPPRPEDETAPPAAHEPDELAEEGGEIPEDHVELGPRLHRPAARASVTIESEFPRSEESLAWEYRVRRVEEACHNADDDARAHLDGKSSLDLLALEETDFEDRIEQLRRAFRAHHALTQALVECRERAEDEFLAALKTLGLEAFAPAWRTAADPDEVSACIALLHEADELRVLARAFDPSIPEMSEWRAGAVEMPRREDLLAFARRLPEVRENGLARVEAENTFLEAARKYLSTCGENGLDASAWLARLGADEITALARTVDPVEWPVVAALLLRHGFDVADDAFSDTSSELLLKHGTHISRRRDLLHFLDPASARLNKHPSARRLLVAERLRDALESGPIAVLADRTSSLSDRDLVGRTVAEIVGLLAEHQEVVTSGADLRRLLADDDAARLEAASHGFLAFATTPNTMTGVFWRLREAARERLFLTAIRDGQPDVGRVRALAQRLNPPADDAVEDMVSSISRETGRVTRVEARHRHSLERYLAEGYAIAREFLSAMPTARRAREDDLRAQLRKRVALLAHTPADELGSQAWLEFELSDMLRSPPTGTASGAIASRLTLVGTPQSLSERRWSHADTNWAREHYDLPEFHLDVERFSSLDIAAAGLGWWAEGRKPDTPAVLDRLISRGEFRAARSALNDAADCAPDGPARDGLAALETRLREVFSAEEKRVRERLAALEAKFGPESISGAQSRVEVENSLKRFDADEALEWCELLEAEAADGADKSKARTNPEEEARRATLVRHLLLAGTAGFDEFASVEQLGQIWDEELARRQGERKHIALLANALAPHAIAIPTLSAEIASLEQRSLEADRWLQDERSSDLAMYSEDAVRKLAFWLGAAKAFDAEARTVLERLVSWFLRFIDERTDALRALAEGERTDAVLERVIEVRGCFANAGDPVSCAAALVESGEAGESDFALADKPESGREAEPRRSPTSATEAPPPIVSASIDLGGSAAALASLIAPIGGEDWAALSEAITSVRRQVSTDEDRRRLDEVEEFAGTVAPLQGEADCSVETAALVAMARVLGGSGGLVQRALSTKRLLEIALLILSAAIRADQGQASEPLRPTDPDGSWTAVLGRKGELLRQLSGPGAPARTARVLENLCAGSLGTDVVERLWHGVTNAPEVGALRSGLLAFLNDRSLDHHVVQLASRYDPGIKERLKQLLELRAVATSRPDLVRVAQTVADQVAAGAKTAPFRLFVRSLPSTAQSVQADLVLTVDDRPTLRLGSVPVPEAQVNLTIEPRGLVPEQIEATLFPEDDITFADGSRRRVLAAQPLYVASEYALPICFGSSWTGTARREGESIRVRVSAKALTGELINRDVVCSLRVERLQSRARRVDDDTLLEAYPGVEGSPAVGEVFVGRGDELERLHETLVSARQPSPVLLTGMRRIGKTSLLFAFHERQLHPDRSGVVTVYLSIAERRSAFLDARQDVGSVFFAAIAHALGKRNFSYSDHNRAVGERLHARLGPDRGAVRRAIQECRDPESLSGFDCRALRTHAGVAGRWTPRCLPGGRSRDTRRSVPRRRHEARRTRTVAAEPQGSVADGATRRHSPRRQQSYRGVRPRIQKRVFRQLRAGRSRGARNI